ncbi:B12-binding domain-containing radical SAM protein [Candidatus Altiarchaeota archaeon]
MAQVTREKDVTKKNVVLIFPRLSIQSPTFLQTPFSLITIAPYLEKAGYRVDIIDIRTTHNFKKTLSSVISQNTVFAGISTMTGSQITNAVEVSKFIKKNFSVPIVWGGIHPTLMPQQVIKEDYVDIVSLGEGEKNIVELATCLEAGQSLKEVKGIHYKEDGEVRETQPNELFDLKDSLPPSWHLIDKSKYNIFGIQTGRGCPYRCEYCYNYLFNKGKWRSKPLDQIFHEIEQLVNIHGVKKILFYDDNFFTSKKRVEDICHFIIENRLDIEWVTTCRSDYFTKYGKEFFQLVKESGCDTLAIGVESGSQRILDLLNKQETLEDSINMAKITNEVGITPECGFMIGIPGETKKDRIKTYDFIDKLVSINPKLYVTSLAIYTPYPGAPLIEKIEKEYNFRMPENLEDWCNFNYHNCNLLWIEKSEQKKMEAISYIPRFVFWREKLKERYVKLWQLPIYYFMIFLAGLRWKYRFFNFPVEYSVLKMWIEH